MAQRRVILLGLIALIFVGGFAFLQKKRADEADLRAGLDAGRILSAVLSRETKLVVARLTGEVAATSNSSSYYFVNVTQATKAPYEIEFFIDFSKMRKSDYHWNAKDRIMTIDAPEATIGKPNIDWTKARIKQSGVWISRGAGISLQQGAAMVLRDKVNEKGKSPDIVEKVREASKAAIRKMLTTPLEVAGGDKITVAVRLPGEEKSSSLSDEQWDMSRPWEEVLRSIEP